MMKYIKWILLCIFVISLMVTIFLYAKFLKKHNYTNKSVDVISELYGKYYLRTGLSYYENDVLIDENLNILDSRYMVFSEDYVKYCNYVEDDTICDEYNYSFDDGILDIYSDDYFIVKEQYNIVITDVGFDLIQDVDNIMVIYHFSQPLG